MSGEKLCDRERIAAVAFDPQTERLNALQEQPCVEGRERRTDIAKQLHASLEDVRDVAEDRRILQSVVRRIGFYELGEPRVFAPVETAAIDDYAADRGAVA